LPGFAAAGSCGSSPACRARSAAVGFAAGAAGAAPGRGPSRAAYQAARRAAAVARCAPGSAAAAAAAASGGCRRRHAERSQSAKPARGGGSGGHKAAVEPLSSSEARRGITEPRAPGLQAGTDTVRRIKSANTARTSIRVGV
jgi:hypothetical protein